MPAQSHVVIGVHGLSSKPPPESHSKDWVSAICEGLSRNFAVNVPGDRVGFELVYWADWLGRAAIAAGKDEEPYCTAPGTGPLPSYQQRFTDQLALRTFDALADPIDWVAGAPPLDWIRRHTALDDTGAALLQRRLVDLGTYYREKEKRDLLRQRLTDALIRNKTKRIMLVAHSMGTIVAYDVLRALGRQAPDLVVEHLITMGSPLGMPYVLRHIRNENPSIRTPSNVRRWSNFADRLDPVAVDVHLGDEFEANDRSVAVADALVLNGYRSPAPADKANHHKVFGYLRAPEVSEVIRTFI